MAETPSWQGQPYKHTHKWTYHMFMFVFVFVFAGTLANLSYVSACKPAHEPSKPLLWASAWQISPSHHFPLLFCNIWVRKLGSFVSAETRKHQQQLHWYYINELLVLVCILFLSRISFLSQTTSSQPSPKGKAGLDKGICTDSRGMLSNCVCHWMGQGGGGLDSRRGKSHIGKFWSGHKP